MLSGGAGRGGEEPDRRVGHVQGSGHKAQLQRHSEALRQGQAHRGVVLEGRGRPAPRRARRQGGLLRRAHRGGGRQGAAAGVTRRASTSGCCTGIPARTWPATTPSPSSCARTASPSGPPTAPEPHPRFETPPGLQLQFDWKESIRMANRDGELFEFNVFAATLGHSRRHIFIRSGTRTTDDLVRCMYATIARLGGRAPRVGHGQHVRPGDGQGRQAPQGPARIRVRQGRPASS